MLRGLFKMFLLSKLMGGAGRARGGRGCGFGVGCLVLILFAIVVIFLLRGCGDAAAPTYDW